MRLLSGAVLLAALTLPRPAVAQDREACVAAYEQGQVAMRRSRLTTARTELQRCMSDACPAVLRTDCATWLREVDTRMATVILSATTAGAPGAHARTVVTDVRVLVDGAVVARQLDGNAIDVDPGAHTFRFEAQGGPAVELNVVVRDGEKLQPIAVDLSPPVVAPPVPQPLPSPAPAGDRAPDRGGEVATPVPWTVYALGAVSVAAAGGFVTFAALGSSAQHDLEPCKPDCASADVDRVRAKYITADVLLGVSLVALGAAAYIYLTRQTGASVRASSAAGLRPNLSLAF